MSELQLLQPNSEFIHRAEPTAEARQIKVFSEIIKRDRGSKGDGQGRNKDQACRELAWIYHMVDYRSPYFNMPEAQREVKVTKDIFNDEKWSPDELVQEGLELYRELAKTPSMKLLESAYKAMSELENYFNGVDFEEVVDGKYKYQAKDVMGALEKLSKLVDGIGELKKQVEKEQQSDSQAWGGIEVNEFSKGE